ncbi:Glucooligosaccharide oxidase [Amanita thiersii Skay4041]|uniref:Glucooligosaccharide oxidase n=1 Tax=Amanita thiersii Skay4041 TaxID=703135 RepID=A0A2A9NW76_9AGAR|nr:Glucooligosaccharide oxidase [Amanita thiersii Skay4041]
MTAFTILLFCAYCIYQVSAAAIADFRGSLKAAGIRGVFPGDPDYAASKRAYNLRFTFSPVAVTYPKDAKQVAEIVKLGSVNNYKIVARSGGHSYIANGLGGKNGAVVVDLKSLSQITVSSNTATIGTGNRLGDVALALNAKGRAIPHGTCPYVGIGGHSSYGGFGFTSRMWGLTLDMITSMDVVLANGTSTTVSKDQSPDLFWAMRGAGGSYGIVTSIKVKTFEAPRSVTIFQYSWNLKASDAAKAVSSFQKFAQGTNLPKEYASEFTIGRGNKVGYISFQLFGGWYGQEDNLKKILNPYLASLPKPSNGKFTTGSFIDSVTYVGGLGTLNVHIKPDATDTFYAKSLMTPENSPISDAALNAFMSYMANDGYKSNTNWFVQMELYGGKNSVINTVPSGATAFVKRNALWTIQFYASSPNYQPPFPNSGFNFLDGMVNSILKNSPSNWDYGAYTNYIDERLSNWQKVYYGSQYQRLKQIKQTYDPKNVFSFPLGIGE